MQSGVTAGLPKYYAGACGVCNSGSFASNAPALQVTADDGTETVTVNLTVRAVCERCPDPQRMTSSIRNRDASCRCRTGWMTLNETTGGAPVCRGCVEGYGQQRCTGSTPNRLRRRSLQPENSVLASLENGLVVDASMSTSLHNPALVARNCIDGVVTSNCHTSNSIHATRPCPIGIDAPGDYFRVSKACWELSGGSTTNAYTQSTGYLCRNNRCRPLAEVTGFDTPLYLITYE